MKITKITAENFGKLKNKDIELSPGVNVIIGANESGKSSLTRFLRFMLYGFTSSRSSELAKNDKKKYTPWDDTSCKGQISIISADENYTVRREQATRASHSITNSQGIPVFSGISAGEAFLGVDAETFDKTALISSGDVFFENAVTLSSAIKNMVFSADSSVDSETALKKLDAFRRSILGKTEKSGRLYEARLELSELINKRSELAEVHKELLGAETALERVRANISKNKAIIQKLEQERNNIDAFNALEKCKKIDAAKEKAAHSKEEYEKQSLALSVMGFVPDRAFLSEMNETLISLSSCEMIVENSLKEKISAKDALNSCYSNPKQLKFNNILHDLNKDANKLINDVSLMKDELKALKKKQKICFGLFFLIVPIIFAIIFGSKAKKIQNSLQKLALQFECADITEFEYLLSSSKSSEQAAENIKKRFEAADVAYENALSRRADTAKKLSNMLEKSGCATAISDISDLADITKEHIKKLDMGISRLESLYNILKVDTAAFETLYDSVDDIQALRSKADQYSQEIPLRDINKNAMELDFYTRANEGLSVQERDYEKRTAIITSNMDKPDELTAKINMLSSEISTLEKQHAALVMAQQAIESAHSSIRQNVSPVLTQEASLLFNEMTGGKYTGLYVDNNLELTFLESGASEYRSVEYLSSGAVDAAYLSLRITLTQYLYNEKPVLIFDDAFTRFDDERLERICKVLEKLSEQYQILILTCHEREAKLLKAKVIKL